MAYQVRYWELYEPDRKSGGTEGPLDFAKWRVHGYYLSSAYRELAEICGDDLQSTLGLFSKLVELAADQHRTYRTGIILDKQSGNRPADIKRIAFLTLFKESNIERDMGYLIQAGWIAEIPDEAAILDDAKSGTIQPSPEVSGSFREAPEDAGKVPPNIEGNVDETKIINRDLEETKRYVEPNRFASEKSLKSFASDTKKKQLGHVGIQSSSFANLMELFRVPSERIHDKTPEGQAVRSDTRTLKTICEFAIKSRDAPEAHRQADELIQLAENCIHQKREHERSKKLAWFVHNAKQRYPGLFA